MTLRYGLAAAAAVTVTICAAAPSVAQDQAAGERTFAMCKGCHTIEKGGRNGIGPNLSGLFGRPAGSVAGYNYSPAMKKSGIRWDDKALDAFLAAPAKKVPGTKMPISVADPARRAALIAYLKSATAN